MKRKKKALLLASVASLCILCGCNNAEVVEIEGEQYVKNGEEYTRVDLTPKVFEPGEHIINYSVDSNDIAGATGWGKGRVYFPETPEGYRFVETIVEGNGGYGSTSGYVNIYVNVVRVEVKGTYNPRTNTVEYIEPGVVVDELTLGN